MRSLVLRGTFSLTLSFSIYLSISLARTHTLPDTHLSTHANTKLCLMSWCSHYLKVIIRCGMSGGMSSSAGVRIAFSLIPRVIISTITEFHYQAFAAARHDHKTSTPTPPLRFICACMPRLPVCSHVLQWLVVLHSHASSGVVCAPASYYPKHSFPCLLITQTDHYRKYSLHLVYYPKVDW